jgi:hypothetical protein
MIANLILIPDCAFAFIITNNMKDSNKVLLLEPKNVLFFSFQSRRLPAFWISHNKESPEILTFSLTNCK